jgi:hypothetical protein
MTISNRIEIRSLWNISRFRYRKKSARRPGVVFTDDFEPNHIAVLFIRDYGREAAFIAWGVADSCALDGDARRYHEWMHVVAAIQTLAECPSSSTKEAR